MLYIFAGLPGVGKSTLAKHLASDISATYLRIDTIEQTIKNSGTTEVGTLGYEIACSLAKENILLGEKVIIDSVNPLEITRKQFRDLALTTNTAFRELEVICSDIREHKFRIENRKSTIERLKQPTWKQVIDREYEKWIASTPIVIDTAEETEEESLHKLYQLLRFKSEAS